MEEWDEGIDQDKVYYLCKTCGFVFQDDPARFPIVCPQCGSESCVRT